MPNVKYTERKAAATTTEPALKELGNGAGSVSMPDTPEDEDIGYSDVEEEHSNPGGSSMKQFPCHFCSKSYTRMSYLSS